MDENCCCKRKKIRTEDEYKKLVNRLNRIEGQIRGLKKMVESDAYCIDILTQSAAAAAALNAFNRELLGDHIRTCVTSDIVEGDNSSTEELIDTLRLLMK